MTAFTRVAILGLFLAIAGCESAGPVASSELDAASIICRPAKMYGATTSGDNREAFQRALDDGCLDLRGFPGKYMVAIPPPPRTPATLTMPPGTTIIGDRNGVESIVFVGDPNGEDWRGLQPHDRWVIDGVNLAVASLSGTWGEQSHLIHVRGPVSGGELAYATLSHPVISGSSRGDCIQFVGYPPSQGATDQRIWDQHVHHVTFSGCARSGVAVHSGLHGRMLPPDVNGEAHSSTRFNHNTFIDTADQDLDEEGSGDVGGIDGSDFVEWDHNEHRVGPHAQSSLAVSIYPGSTWFHHNTLDGRGLDIYGGYHEVSNNIITQKMPNDTAPVVYVRKTGSSEFHHETWTRSATAGPGGVFVAAQKITAPTNLILRSVSIIQHTGYGAMSISGIVGFQMAMVSVLDDGPMVSKQDGTPVSRDVLHIEGTNSIKTTGVVISDSSFVGPVRAAISISGSYDGVGTVDIRGSSSAGTMQGVRCENTTTTSTTGGISGPIIYKNNSMPSPACSGLPK